MTIGSLLLIFTTTTQQLGLPPKLLESVCYIESHYDIAAVHKDDGGENSLGVCQIKYSTAKWLGFKGSEKELMNPKTNAYYAGKYLKYNINRYNSITKAIIAYNRGNAKNLQKTKYSDKVLKKWGKLK